MSVFVVIRDENRHGIVIGKNSNRPPNEVQELVLEKDTCSEGDVKCTYTTVSAGMKTHAVILSKPAGIWGCEMGANSDDVTGFTVCLKDDPTSGLLPQDILRLSLERSSSSAAAVDTVGALISAHGGDTPSAYVLGDRTEVWYVEAVGRAWVAERLLPGVKVLPPALHIGVGYQKSADNLEELAKKNGWTGEGKVNWSEIFVPNSDDDKQASREQAVLNKHFQDISEWSVNEMTRVLRDVDNRISRSANDTSPTAASMISVVGGSGPGCHWFTATPDPTLSVFKPFVFTPHARISHLTATQPGGDGEHQLFRLHGAATSSGENKVISLLQQMEANCINEVNSFMNQDSQNNLSEVDDLLKDCVEAEVKFYK